MQIHYKRRGEGRGGRGVRKRPSSAVCKIPSLDEGASGALALHPCPALPLILSLGHREGCCQAAEPRMATKGGVIRANKLTSGAG